MYVCMYVYVCMHVCIFALTPPLSTPLAPDKSTCGGSVVFPLDAHPKGGSYDGV